jgi:hypothetical protein
MMNAQSQSFDSVQTQSQALDTSHIYQEGFVAGTLGAATIAIWFLFLDTIKGRPLFTPTVLGTALLKGMQELATPQQLAVSVDMVVWFTFAHWLVFVVLGCIASRLLGLAERNANFGFGILLLFVVFEFGFLGGATLFAEPVLHALTWPTILIGNLLAAAVMGLYFWRQHPQMIIRP